MNEGEQNGGRHIGYYGRIDVISNIHDRIAT
jgi:hypothetical protein